MLGKPRGGQAGKVSGQDGGGWSEEPAWPREARGLRMGRHSVPFGASCCLPPTIICLPASLVWPVSIGGITSFCSLLILVVTGS